jgi:ribose transport system substrate-binding protein
MQKLFCLIILSFLFVFQIACTQDAANTTTTGNSTAKKKIGVTLLTREDDFYRELEAGLQENAAKNGFELIIQSGDKDLSKQQSQIDNFIVQKVDAIIVCPTDTKGIAPAIERANAANIPVFTADIAAAGGKVVSHVASDNVAGGKLAAEYIAKALNGEGKVGIIGQPEVQSTIDREKGLRDEIGKSAKITIVPTLNGEGKRDRALKAAEDLLQGNPDIKAIFCINDETALGALSAVESREMKDVVIVGYDAAPEAVEKIKKGTNLKADVAQQPRDIGAKTIDAIARHLKGESVEPIVAVPVKIVDK